MPKEVIVRRGLGASSARFIEPGDAPGGVLLCFLILIRKGEAFLLSSISHPKIVKVVNILNKNQQVSLSSVASIENGCLNIKSPTISR
jgi:hypothetical protein